MAQCRCSIITRTILQFIGIKYVIKTRVFCCRTKLLVSSVLRWTCLKSLEFVKLWVVCVEYHILCFSLYCLHLYFLECHRHFFTSYNRVQIHIGVVFFSPTSMTEKWLETYALGDDECLAQLVHICKTSPYKILKFWISGLEFECK